MNVSGGCNGSLLPKAMPRMLRVEFKGQPYDWFSLDDMGEIVRSDDFANTLRENIVHYFAVPYECQVLFDEDGILGAPVDFARSLQRPQPYFKVYDVRELPSELREQAVNKLASIAESVARSQRMLNTYQPQPTRVVTEPIGVPSAGEFSRNQGTGLVGTPRGIPGGRPAAWNYPVEPVNNYSDNPGTQPTPWKPDVPLEPVRPMENVSQYRSPYMASSGLSQMGQTSIARGQTFQAETTNSFGVALDGGQIGCTGFGGASLQTGTARNIGTAAGDSSFEVMLTKTKSDERFGFANVPSSDGRSLLVSWIDEGGLLGNWNNYHSTCPVRDGDVIVSVNGVNNDSEAMRQQLGQSHIRMTISGAGSSRLTRA